MFTHIAGELPLNLRYHSMIGRCISDPVATWISFIANNWKDPISVRDSSHNWNYDKKTYGTPFFEQIKQIKMQTFTQFKIHHKISPFIFFIAMVKLLVL